MPFSFKNFYHPAPAQVQKATAMLKVFGGLLASASAAEYTPPKFKPLCFFGGLVVCAVAEGLEKLWPQAELPDEAAQPAPADAEPQQPNTGQL